MKNKYLVKVEDGEYVVFLHDGYSGFSYGISVDPLKLGYGDYKKLRNYLIKENHLDFVQTVEESTSYDFILPTDIANNLQKRMLTFSPPNCCEYSSFEVENKSISLKEKLLKNLEE